MLSDCTVSLKKKKRQIWQVQLFKCGGKREEIYYAWTYMEGPALLGEGFGILTNPQTSALVRPLDVALHSCKLVQEQHRKQSGRTCALWQQREQLFSSKPFMPLPSIHYLKQNRWGEKICCLTCQNPPLLVQCFLHILKRNLGERETTKTRISYGSVFTK